MPEKENDPCELCFDLLDDVLFTTMVETKPHRITHGGQVTQYDFDNAIVIEVKEPNGSYTRSVAYYEKENER